MAERISAPTPATRNTAPWRQWADGAWWRLKAGEDFTGDPDRARKTAHAWAGRNGYTLSAQQADGDLEVCFTAHG